MNGESCQLVENRTVLFLYPDFEDYDTKEQKQITNLISDLKIIINTSNSMIEKILEDGSFSYIRCLPLIEMEEATKQPSEKYANLVRVCVIGYDNEDYEEIYNNICDKYIKNKLDITHLVGLKIKSNLEGVKFSKPSDSPFDVIIEANLFNLDLVLISIMLDTSIYHYFSLNNDIKYRKNFSKLKIKGIKQIDLIGEFGEIGDLSNIDYLPFSYPYVKKYFMANVQNQTCQEITDKLIKEYFSFILSFICINIEFNKLKEPKKLLPNSIDDNIKKALNIIIKKDIFKSGNTYILSINNNINEHIKENDFSIIECNNVDLAIKSWLSKFKEPLTNTSLFQIRIGD